MSHYRRVNAEGGSYFFTVVTYRRRSILCDPPIRKALRRAIHETRKKYPFTINAWVLMPDHLHCIWTLPEGGADFSRRWSLIKRRVSLDCREEYKKEEWLTASKHKHRESTLWQRRYWEHQIRDQNDYNRHMDYVHYNPVKHELCDRPDLWPWSTLHHYIKEGIYPTGWALQNSDFNLEQFGE